MCSILPVSLDCPLLIAPSVFSNIYCCHGFKGGGVIYYYVHLMFVLSAAELYMIKVMRKHGLSCIWQVVMLVLALVTVELTYGMNCTDTSR